MTTTVLLLKFSMLANCHTSLIPSPSGVTTFEMANSSPSASTRTSNSQIDDFPVSSMKVYVTVVLPIGNLLPGACDFSTVTSPQLTTAIGSSHVAGVKSLFSSAFTVTVPGYPSIFGSAGLVTTTRSEIVSELPAASTAVNFTLVGPNGNS